MKNTEEVAARCDNVQASLPHQLQRLSVPVAAKPTGKIVCMTILPAPRPCAITAAMLD
jgi:hypothetical protein